MAALRRDTWTGRDEGLQKGTLVGVSHYRKAPPLHKANPTERNLREFSRISYSHRRLTSDHTGK